MDEPRNHSTIHLVRAYPASNFMMSLTGHSGLEIARRFFIFFSAGAPVVDNICVPNTAKGSPTIWSKFLHETARGIDLVPRVGTVLVVATVVIEVSSWRIARFGVGIDVLSGGRSAGCFRRTRTWCERRTVRRTLRWHVTGHVRGENRRGHGR